MFSQAALLNVGVGDSRVLCPECVSVCMRGVTNIYGVFCEKFSVQSGDDQTRVDGEEQKRACTHEVSHTTPAV